MAIIETADDIFGEPVVLADYDTNPPAKVTAIGYPSRRRLRRRRPAADHHARALLQRRHRGPHRVERQDAGRREAHPTHRRRQSRQQRRPAVRRMRARHRHQHAAHARPRNSTTRRASSSPSISASCTRCSRKTSSPIKRRQALHARHGHQERRRAGHDQRGRSRRCSTALPPASRRAPATATSARAATPSASPASWQRAARRDIDVRMTASEPRLHRAEGDRGVQRIPALRQPTALRLREDLRSQASRKPSPSAASRFGARYSTAPAPRPWRIAARPPPPASGAAARTTKASGLAIVYERKGAALVVSLRHLRTDPRATASSSSVRSKASATAGRVRAACR